MMELDQHQVEIQANQNSWRHKPLLQTIYADFYRRIIALIDPQLPGKIVEIGSGIGNLKEHLPGAISTDLFPNPWLDLVCDGYDLPFADGSLSHLVLFDVFHHLQVPNAFLREAQRALVPGGRVILFEPFISLSSWPAYGLLHHEAVGWNRPIESAVSFPRPRHYYAAQGNATRLFFRNEWTGWPAGWRILSVNAFSSFSYLLSGGYSKPALYPKMMLPSLQGLDRWLSRWAGCFGARCLIALEKNQ